MGTQTCLSNTHTHAHRSASNFTGAPFLMSCCAAGALRFRTPRPGLTSCPKCCPPCVAFLRTCMYTAGWPRATDPCCELLDVATHCSGKQACAAIMGSAAICLQANMERHANSAEGIS